MNPLKESIFQKQSQIQVRGELYDLSLPKVMGILNVTPDSFYDGGKYDSTDALYQRIDALVEEGADIIDIGGYSSRPGALDISASEEQNRIIPALDYISKKYPKQLISIDTFRSSILKNLSKDYPIDFVNDISAGNLDSEMFEYIGMLSIPYIMMHMPGNPQTMMSHQMSEQLLNEVFKFFSKKIEQLRYLGVKDIIIDPGFGFGKNVDENFKLLKDLDSFKFFELPILIGISRKSMIYKSLQVSPEESLNGSSALHMAALMKGANILRVHDVKEAREVVVLFEKLMNN